MTYDPQRIKDVLDIGDLCGLDPKYSAGNVVCPFDHHNDSSGDGGSCNADRRKQVFCCYGCDAAGDVIDFHGYQLFGLSYRRSSSNFHKAIEAAAQTAGIAPGHSPIYRPKPKAATVEDAFRRIEQQGKASKARPETAAKNIEHQHRLQNKWCDAAADYLRSRGLNPDIARQHGAGYTPNWLGAARVTWPMTIPSGEIRQFVGRALPPWKDGDTYKYTENGKPVTRKAPKMAKQSRKSLQLSEDGGKIGGWFNAEALSKHWTIYIVEGVPDALAMIQSGYLGTVAPIGTSLGGYDPNWFTLVDPFPRPVFIGFNRDENQTGQRRALDIKAELEAKLPGLLNVSIVHPPEGFNDWADMVNQGTPITVPKFQEAERQQPELIAQQNRTLDSIDHRYRKVKVLDPSTEGRQLAIDQLLDWAEHTSEAREDEWLSCHRNDLFEVLDRLCVLGSREPFLAGQQIYDAAYRILGARK